jgi:hypothetical protein
VPLHPAREPSPDLRLPADALTLTAARLVALETHPQDSILALVQAGLHPNSGPAENQGCDGIVYKNDAITCVPFLLRS